MSTARPIWLVKDSVSADAARRVMFKKRAPCMKPPDKDSLVEVGKTRAWYAENISKMLQFAAFDLNITHFNQYVMNQMLATTTTNLFFSPGCGSRDPRAADA